MDSCFVDTILEYFHEELRNRLLIAKSEMDFFFRFTLGYFFFFFFPPSKIEMVRRTDLFRVLAGLRHI